MVEGGSALRAARLSTRMPGVRVPILCVTLALLGPSFFVGCELGDTDVPGSVSGFAYDSGDRRYEWIASGDDGDAGFAVITDIRHTDGDLLSFSGSAGLFSDLPLPRQAVGEPQPRLPGSVDFHVSRRVDPTGYYRHYIRTFDEVSNGSSVVENMSGVPLATNPVQLSLLQGMTLGPVDARADVDGDGLADVAYIDADRDLLFIHFGRSGFPYFAASVDVGSMGTVPDPDNDSPGACGGDGNLFCRPDIVVDLSNLGAGIVTGLVSGDLTGDGRDELVLAAPDFAALGEADARGAVFVLSFQQTSVPMEAGNEPFFFLRNRRTKETFAARVTAISPTELTLDQAVGIDAPASDDQIWRLFSGLAVQPFPEPPQPPDPDACPAGIPCTGTDLEVFGGGSRLFESASVDFEGLAGEHLLVIYDGANNMEFAGVVEDFEESEQGFFNRIRVNRDLADPALSMLSASTDRTYALLPLIADGGPLATSASDTMVAIGGFRPRFDGGTPDGSNPTVMVLLDPTDPGQIPSAANEMRPLASFLGPEAGPFSGAAPRFGLALTARTDINFDGFADLAVGVPGLDTIPVRYGNFATLVDRGGALVIFGRDTLGVDDVAAPGGSLDCALTAGDGCYDLGPDGADRPHSIILGRDAGDETGTTIAGGRGRFDGISTPAFSEFAGTNIALAVGAPGASPEGRAEAGAVYLFQPNNRFEIFDPVPQGAVPDGVWDLSGDVDASVPALQADIASAEIWGQNAGDRLGEFIVADADLNGDRVLDLAIGAPGNSDPGDMVFNPGRVFIFFVTVDEKKPEYFLDRTVRTTDRGRLPRNGTFGFTNRGNKDVERFVDGLDSNQLAERTEDRCVFCIYNLGAGSDLIDAFDPLTTGVSGPDLIIEGEAFPDGSITQVGLEISAGHYDRDPFEELFLVARRYGPLPGRTLEGDWLLVLNGQTNLLLEYRERSTFLPSRRPENTVANYPVPTGVDPMTMTITFEDAPGNATTVGQPKGVGRWLAQAPNDIPVGQIQVDVGLIRQDAAATEEQCAFGRALTAEASNPATESTAQLEFRNGTGTEAVVRWNALSTGGFFAPGCSGATATFTTDPIRDLSVGADFNGDFLSDLLFVVGDMDLRSGY